MESELAGQLLKAAKIVETQLDQEIQKLEISDESDLEEIRRKRMLQMKKIQKEKEDLLSNGHGKLSEVSDEREFFQAAKESAKLVCHFYDPTNRKSPVVDKVLQKISVKHIHTRFISVNAEKVPFLIKRLNIRKVPTIGVSIDSKMADYLRVETEFGSNPEEEIKPEVMEAKLARSGVIDWSEPIGTKVKSGGGKIRGAALPSALKKKAIRDEGEGDSEDDW